MPNRCRRPPQYFNPGVDGASDREKKRSAEELLHLDVTTDNEPGDLVIANVGPNSLPGTVGGVIQYANGQQEKLMGQ